MPSTLLSTFQVLIQSAPQCYELGVCIRYMLQMGKPRHSRVKELARSHTGQQRSCDKYANQCKILIM